MIIDISEEEYRAIKKNSSSSLKDFAEDRRKYYKRHILKEKVTEKYNAALEMGRIVETLLMEPDRFDDQFFMSSCANIPGGLMGDFVLALVKYTIKYTNEDGVCTEDFMNLAELALADSGFKQSLPTVLKKFYGSDAEVYFNELKLVEFNDLTVVTPDDINNGERIVEELKNNRNTSTVVSLKSSAKFEVYNQIKIDGFSIDGMPLKAMLDKVIVNHSEKIIQLYDLKCTWSVEKFYKDYYLYRKAYIPAYVYYQALLQETKCKDSDFYGYTVKNPMFIVCDSINYYDPLIFITTNENLHEAYHGFSVKGYHYPGVKEIISDLKWAIDNDSWRISRENYMNKGLVSLK